MTPFAAYMGGFLLLVAGVALAAWLLGVPLLWVVVGVIIAVAAGFIFATSHWGGPPSAPGKNPKQAPPKQHG